MVIFSINFDDLNLESTKSAIFEKNDPNNWIKEMILIYAKEGRVLAANSV